MTDLLEIRILDARKVCEICFHFVRLKCGDGKNVNRILCHLHRPLGTHKNKITNKPGYSKKVNKSIQQP